MHPGPAPRPSHPTPHASAPRPEEGWRPFFRHIDFFDPARDVRLEVKEIARGLERLGMSNLAAWSIAIGTLALRLPSRRFAAMQFAGHVEPGNIEQFIHDLDPLGQGRITLEQFEAWGLKLALERAPGKGILDYAKRRKMQLEFHATWLAVLAVVGHRDPKNSARYLTPEDIRRFYDGSLFDPRLR